MSFVLSRLGPLPADFPALAATAKAEGYEFLERLGARWDGACYVDDTLASVWGAFGGEALVAIGAQTHDDYDLSPQHRRIRHFYVRPNMRRTGIGYALAQRLIADAFALAPRLHLRATHDVSRAFWDAVGFVRVDHPNRTHEMLRV